MGLDTAQRDRLLMTAIGLLAGLVFWATDRFDDAPLGTLSACARYSAAAAGLAAQFTWTGRHRARWGVIALGLGALVALVSAWVWQQIPVGEVPYRGDDQRIWNWVLGAFVFLYAVGPFAQILQRSGRLRFPYLELFHHSWNNFFVGLVGFLFLGVFVLLITIWGQLFELVGISLFADLFDTDFFKWVFFTGAFGYGVGVGRESERVIDTLRRVALLIGHVLLPLVSGIALAFLAVLPFTGLEALWDTKNATSILLWLLGFLILFLNAVFEDGEGERPYPTALRRLVEAALLAMPIYALIAFHATDLRIEQYGLTPQRVHGRLFVIVIGLYSLGYAAAVVARRATWMGAIRPVNVALAWVIAVLAVAVHTPLLDPLRLSAADQYQRVARGEVDVAEFDFAYLRFHLGRAGWERLAALEALESHPQAAAIREQIAFVRAADSYGHAKVRFREELRADHFERHPASLEVDDALLARIREGQTRVQLTKCVESGECALFAVDLDADGNDEVCSLDAYRNYDIDCFQRDGDGWKHLGPLSFVRGGDKPAREQLLEALRRTGASTREATWRQLVLGESAFQLNR